MKPQENKVPILEHRVAMAFSRSPAEQKRNQVRNNHISHQGSGQNNLHSPPKLE